MNMDPFIPIHQAGQDLMPTPPDSQYYQELMQNQMTNLMNHNNTVDGQAWQWAFAPPISGYNQNQVYPQIEPHGIEGRPAQDYPQAQTNSLLPHIPDSKVTAVPSLLHSDSYTSENSDYVQDDNTDSWKKPKEQAAYQNPPEKSSGTKGKRRGPFQRSEQREETGLTRKLGACVRCSMQRIRVSSPTLVIHVHSLTSSQCIPDPNNSAGTCKTCIQAAQTRTRWLPCLRYKITDSELLDNAKCPRPTWTSRWKKMEMVDITNWADDEIKTIDVTQEVGNNYYTLKVRKFVPLPDDALARRWVWDGQKYEYECAPYAVADMREAGKVLARFSDNTLPTAIPFWIKGNTLLTKTYIMAWTYSRTAEVS